LSKHVANQQLAGFNSLKNGQLTGSMRRRFEGEFWLGWLWDVSKGFNLEVPKYAAQLGLYA